MFIQDPLVQSAMLTRAHVPTRPIHFALYFPECLLTEPRKQAWACCSESQMGLWQLNADICELICLRKVGNVYSCSRNPNEISNIICGYITFCSIKKPFLFDSFGVALDKSFTTGGSVRWVFFSFSFFFLFSNSIWCADWNTET